MPVFLEKINIMGRTRKNDNNGFGIFLITLGLLLLAWKLNVFPFLTRHIVFRWETILILIGFIMLFGRSKVTGFILISIGIFFLLPEIMFIPPFFLKLYWPAILILVGLVLILRPSNGSENRC